MGVNILGLLQHLLGGGAAQPQGPQVMPIDPQVASLGGGVPPDLAPPTLAGALSPNPTSMANFAANPTANQPNYGFHEGPIAPPEGDVAGLRAPPPAVTQDMLTKRGWFNSDLSPQQRWMLVAQGLKDMGSISAGDDNVNGVGALSATYEAQAKGARDIAERQALFRQEHPNDPLGAQAYGDSPADFVKALASKYETANVAPGETRTYGAGSGIPDFVASRMGNEGDVGFTQDQTGIRYTGRLPSSSTVQETGRHNAAQEAIDQQRADIEGARSTFVGTDAAGLPIYHGLSGDTKGGIPIPNARYGGHKSVYEMRRDDFMAANPGKTLADAANFAAGHGEMSPADKEKVASSQAARDVYDMGLQGPEATAALAEAHDRHLAALNAAGASPTGAPPANPNAPPAAAVTPRLAPPTNPAAAAVLADFKAGKIDRATAKTRLLAIPGMK